jgi:hypothetical protein
MIEQLRAQAEEDRTSQITCLSWSLELAGERLARALSEGADAFSDLEEIERRIEVSVEEETWEAFYGHLNDDPGLLEEPAMLCLWTMVVRAPAREESERASRIVRVWDQALKCREARAVAERLQNVLPQLATADDIAACEGVVGLLPQCEAYRIGKDLLIGARQGKLR